MNEWMNEQAWSLCYWVLREKTDFWGARIKLQWLWVPEWVVYFNHLRKQLSHLKTGRKHRRLKSEKSQNHLANKAMPYPCCVTRMNIIAWKTVVISVISWSTREPQEMIFPLFPSQPGLWRAIHRDFPGGPVYKTLCFQCRGPPSPHASGWGGGASAGKMKAISKLPSQSK